MYKGKRISVSVPAYKEEELIAETIRSMPEIVDHIIVVDDCSPDLTSERARAVDDPRLEVIRLEENQGVGGAVLAGHRRGLELGAEVMVVMAGDNQMDPDYLPALLDPVVSGERGYAKANRFFTMDSFAGMPRHRVVGNVILSFMSKLASGYWNLFDPQNGYTAIDSGVLRRLDLDRIATRYEFENDLLINLNILDVRATDVSIPARYANETSTIKLSKVVPAISFLMVRGLFRRVMAKYVVRSFSPIALFLFTGLAMVTFSVVYGIWVLVETIGPEEATAGTVILDVIPFVVGVQLLISALTLDIQRSPDQ